MQLPGPQVNPQDFYNAFSHERGAVVIDFVTMRSTYDRDKVQAALKQAAEQRAPGPEEMQERFVRHGAVVEIADQPPGEVGIEQVGGAARCVEGSRHHERYPFNE